MKKKKTEVIKPSNESWEVVVGGNFLHVWESGRYEHMKYLQFEDGKVADIAFPNVYEATGEDYLSHEDAFAKVMYRAYQIAAAPEMLRMLERALPIIEREAEQRDDGQGTDDIHVVGYWTEMGELADAIATLIKEAKEGK
jgi:hypothetical protein